MMLCMASCMRGVERWALTRAITRANMTPWFTVSDDPVVPLMPTRLSASLSET